MGIYGNDRIFGIQIYNFDDKDFSNILFEAWIKTLPLLVIGCINLIHYLRKMFCKAVEVAARPPK